MNSQSDSRQTDKKMLMHDVFFITVTEVGTTVTISNRNIGSKTVRHMLTMSHYKYHQRLEWAATRYPGRYVLVTEEPGTSKTCTNCGYWNSNLGSDEVYCCGGCGICVGRDLAGARNNFFSEYGKAVLVGWDGNSA